jgi:hypothetical protein
VFGNNAPKKVRPGVSVGGHEQENHDEETLKRHMDSIDKATIDKLALEREAIEEEEEDREPVGR